MSYAAPIGLVAVPSGGAAAVAAASIPLLQATALRWWLPRALIDATCSGASV